MVGEDKEIVSPLAKYTFTFITGDRSGAGTSTNVINAREFVFMFRALTLRLWLMSRPLLQILFTLYGQTGDTSELRLERSLARASSVAIEHEGVWLGPLTKLRFVTSSSPRPLLLPSFVESILLTRAFSVLDQTSFSVGHDNSGMSASWFLDKVKVYDHKVNKEYFFLCGRWLAKDEVISSSVVQAAIIESQKIETRIESQDDGQLIRELAASDKDGIS